MEQDNQQGGPVPDMKENNEVPQNETPSQLSHSFSSGKYEIRSIIAHTHFCIFRNSVTVAVLVTEEGEGLI